MDDLVGLSRHARGVAEWLRASGRRQFGRRELWQAVADVSPASAGTGERRWILSAALEELRAAGAVTVSATTDDGVPPMPTRVRLVDGLTARVATAPPVVWHPSLSAADGRADPRGVLRAVNAWLFGGGTRAEPAPLRERALEITGDEKAFDGGLGPVLTLGILRAYRVVLPLHRERLGDGPVLLVVENADTYDSLRRVLADGPGPVGRIAWGAGAAFTSSVQSLGDRPPGAIRYFGDLDAAGLRIPATASVLAGERGLPAVRPAAGLYTLLLTHGRRQDGRTPVSHDQAQDLAAWLDPAHRDAAAALLTDGGRYAQEACHLSLLAADDTWRETLDQ